MKKFQCLAVLLLALAPPVLAQQELATAQEECGPLSPAHKGGRECRYTGIKLDAEGLKAVLYHFAKRPPLCRSNLRGADLSDANLHNTSLTGADLRDADLRGANLIGL